MLIPMTGEMVSKYYDLVRHALDNSLAPTTYASTETVNNCFLAIYRGDMTCWALFDRAENDQILLHGFIFTTPTYDACTCVRNLLIYSTYTFTPVKDFLNTKWVGAMEVLRKFAKEKGYHRIIAYTNVKRVVDIVKSLGGKAEFIFLSLDLDSEVE